MIAKLNIQNIIPYIPYYSGLSLGILLIILSLLSGVSTILYTLFITNNLKKFLKKEQGVSSKKEILLKLLKVLLIAFIITFIISFIVCVISSREISFWHTWNWWV